MGKGNGTGAAWLEKGRWLFAGECTFVAGAVQSEQLPLDMETPEIAFAGRSNVGKSSLINALTGRGALARVSVTPGATRQINFFSLRDRLMLVDLPGYGYAKVSKKESLGWNHLILGYLKGRPQLRRVCLLVDARRGLKPHDEEVMRFMDTAAVVYQVILTKCDKVTEKEVSQVEASIVAKAEKHPALHPEIIKTSCKTRQGIDIVRAHLASFT